MANVVISLSVMQERLAVCRLDPKEDIPQWALDSSFCSITRTPEELAIVCNQENVPPSVKCARDWRALKMEGPFDFALVGILAAVVDPLADEAIPVLSIATYDTDYILVRSGQYERAVAVLVAAGHRIKRV